MSKSSKKNIQNFEQLYYSLKAEYEQMQKDNNEIYKEYESTIQMLTDSVKELQNQRSSMTKKLSEIEKEKESLKNKNYDKILDIQDLNKQNEKLKEEIKKIKEDKKIRDTKIIVLENDTDHFQKLIRQNEAIIDDLNYKIEEALEENITIQTEFEIYKQIMSEELMRKEEELKEIKNDMYSKNLMIKKLKNQYSEESTSKNKIFQFKFKPQKSTNKNNKNKMNHSYSYSRDNDFRISFNKERKFYENIILNSPKANEKSCYTNNKEKRFISLLPLLSSIELSSKKYRYKLIPSNKVKNSEKNKSNSLKTPSNKKIIKYNNNGSYAYSYTYKKIYDDSNEFKQINKFVINTADEKNEDTTLDLSTFNPGKDINLNVEKNFTSNFISNSKLEDDEIIIYDNKAFDIEPFKDVFLKKLLNSKKLSNNLGKLFNLNQQKKNKKYIRMTRNKIAKQKIGYKIK